MQSAPAHGARTAISTLRARPTSRLLLYCTGGAVACRASATLPQTPADSAAAMGSRAVENMTLTGPRAASMWSMVSCARNMPTRYETASTGSALDHNLTPIGSVPETLAYSDCLLVKTAQAEDAACQQGKRPTGRQEHAIRKPVCMWTVDGVDMLPQAIRCILQVTTLFLGRLSISVRHGAL